MPILALRSPDNRALWRAFVDAFLKDNGERIGPTDYPSFAWLTHRIQRDALYREAAERGCKGWLAPPLAFFSDLPRLFDIQARPADLLHRQVLIDHLAALHGNELRLDAASRFDHLGTGRAHDALFGELVAEGVKPDVLEQSLSELPGDGFAQARNAWLVTVFREYLQALEDEGRYDPRAIHTLVAERIDSGALPAALSGAKALHIYGLTTLRTRRRLMEALRRQGDVAVVLYLPDGPETEEWSAVIDQETVLGTAPPPVRVQPAPDERRDFEWVALEAKKLIVEQGVVPERIAVVARTGREDTRSALETLAQAGVPATARIRSPLAEVPALKALLLLLRGAAADWPYRALRHALESPYFDLSVDLRSIDHLAHEKSIAGLDQWTAELAALHTRTIEGEEAEAEEMRREGIYTDRLDRDRAELRRFAEQVVSLSEPRTVAQWLAVTRELLDPGWFDFRRRLCDAPQGHWEIVRLDQQAVKAVDGMLQGWASAEPDGPLVDPAEWYGRLRRFLSANEIALSTPVRTGVQILEAHEAALFPFEHTFVVHANDGEFPRRPSVRWLFTDEELSALRNLGLPLADRAEALRRERVLWRAVTANPSVTVTYRTADPNGVPLLPSLMVPEHDPSTEIPRTQFVWPEPFNLAHAERAAMHRVARREAGAETAGVALVSADRIRHGVLAGCAERSRQDGAPGAWNGSMRDPQVLEHIGRRFGPDRLWSPSQLEKYAQNPFLFLVERVLHLEELAEAEEETTPMTFGGVAHRLLEQFYGAFDDPYPSELSGDALDLWEEIADRVFAAVEGEDETWLGVPTLWAVTRRGIRETVAEFLAWELPLLTDREPHLMELAFGFDEDRVWIEGLDLAGNQTRLLLRGRIDRIDRSNGNRHHVIDYKSGGTPTRQGYEDGGTLQGPLYMAAIGGRGLPPASAMYLSIRQQKKGAPVAWGNADCERALRIALSIPGRVRAGLFEPKAAKSSKWPGYWLGEDIARVKAIYRDGSRWDG